MKRSEAFRVRLTIEERAAIDGKAAKVGLTTSDYVRRCALSRTLPAPSRATDFETRQELRRIGVNLNQIAKAMNAQRQVAPSDLAVTLARLNTMLDAMMEESGL